MDYGEDYGNSGPTADVQIATQMKISDSVYETVHISNGDMMYELDNAYVSRQRFSTEDVGISIEFSARELSIRRMTHRKT